MPDYIAVCVSEARLSCLKRAVAQKVRGAERHDFMNRCLIQPSAWQNSIKYQRTSQGLPAGLTGAPGDAAGAPASYPARR